jgi:hypothetical protein
MKTRLGQAFLDASLIGAERAAALQQQGDAFERRTAARPMMFQPILKLNIVAHDELRHGLKSTIGSVKRHRILRCGLC